MSVLTKATPLTGRQRRLAIEATSKALENICDEGSRCCKHSCRKEIDTAVELLDGKLGIKLEKSENKRCIYPERNKECIRLACPYYKE